MQLAPADDRLAYWCPRPVDRSRRELRLERFGTAAVQTLGLQVGPLANVRSSSGCAVVLRSDSPWVELQLARLRHHQPVAVGIDLEVIAADGTRRITPSLDLRESSGAVTVRLASGLERGQAPAELWLWLPSISTAAVAGLGLAEASQVTAVELPRPRWLAIGDSLTQGFCVEHPSRTWVNRCSRRWGLPAWNLGVGGLGIEPALFQDALAAQRWELVTVGLGSNHAWRDQDVDLVAGRCCQLAKTLEAGGHRRLVWVLPSWKPLEDGLGPPDFMGVPLDARAAERLQRIRGILREELAAFPKIEVVEDLLPHDHRLLADGLHPGAYASSMLAEALDLRLQPA